jgi:hypothetical protein
MYVYLCVYHELVEFCVIGRRFSTAIRYWRYVCIVVRLAIFNFFPFPFSV